MSKWNEKVFGEVATTSKGRLTLQSESKEQDFLPLINTDAVNGKPTLFGNSKGAILCEEDDVLMLWDGERSGLVAIGYSGVVGSTFAKLTPYDFIDSKYLFYFLDSKFYWIQGQRTGTGVPHVPKNLDKILWVKYPENKPEQQQIAKILSTADAVIEKTQAAIAKYKAIKQGMLQDLFTRGIDLNSNKLRPRYEDAPELYKESKLGWIPREWEVAQLGKVGEFKNGINKDKNSFGHGTLFVNIGDAYLEVLNCSNLNRVKVTINEIRDYELSRGDLIFVRSSVKPSGIGYNTLFNEFFEPVVFCGFMIRYRFEDKTVFIPEFYNSYFRYEEFRNRLIGVSTVSANTNVNQVALSGLFVIHPNEKEQQRISERLKAIDNKLQTEQSYLQKMQSLKKGLMEDLLSGKKCLNLDFQDEQINQDSKTILQSVNRVNQDADNYPVNPKIE